MTSSGIDFQGIAVCLLCLPEQGLTLYSGCKLGLIPEYGAQVPLCPCPFIRPVFKGVDFQGIAVCFLCLLEQVVKFYSWSNVRFISEYVAELVLCLCPDIRHMF